MTELLTRSIQIEEVTEERTFTGLFAPYDEVIEVGGYKEKYDRGTFTDAPLVPIVWNHSQSPVGGEPPIGMVLAYKDTDRGLEVEAELFDTPRGNEVYTALKRGALNGLSASFSPTSFRMEEDVTVYERAELREVSVVNRPAYPSAKISEVRSDPEQINKEVSKETTTMETELNTYDDSELRSEVADLRRAIEVSNTKEEETPSTKFRSFGDYVKAVAHSEPEALGLLERAYTGGTSADSVLANGWAKDIIKVVNAGRPVLNAFSKGQWISEGSNIEYAKLNSNTIAVDSQPHQGDDLTKGKVTVTSAYAPKITAGGWTEMSFQEVEEASVNILDVAFQAMAAEYARETESYVRDALASAGHGVSADLSTFGGWVAFLVDSAVYLDGQGLAPEFVVVSTDVFKTLAGFSSSSNYLLSRDNGSVNVTNVSGNVLSLPLVVIPGSSIAKVAHSSAIKTFEQPGAPFTLQDQNIVNLSKQFSVYGRIAVATQNSNAVVKVA